MPRRVKRAPDLKLQFTWLKTSGNDHLPLLVKESDDVPLVSGEEGIKLLHLKEHDDECQKLLEDASQFLLTSLQNAKEAKDKLRTRRLSVAPTATIVPLTPHTNKHKRVRKISRGDPVSSIGFDQNDSLEEISATAEENSNTKDVDTVCLENSGPKNQYVDSAQQNVQAVETTTKPNKKSKSDIKKRPPSSTVRTRRVTRASKVASGLPDIAETEILEKKLTSKKGKQKKTVTLKEPCMVEDAEILDVANVCDAPAVEITPNDISTPAAQDQEPPSENPDNKESVEVRQLIAIHEAFIDKHHIESCETPGKIGTEQMDGHLKSQEKSGNRSMIEQVESCVKKKPFVKVFKIATETTPNERMMTPEQPITLKLELGSSDDETDDDDVAQNKVISNLKSDITATPVGTVSPRAVLPVRRSLNLCLSFSNDDSSEEATFEVKTTQDEGGKGISAAISDKVEDSLDEDSDGEGKKSNDSSVSSSAATIMSEDFMDSALVQECVGSQEIRRSSRTKRNAIEAIPEEYVDSPTCQKVKQPKIIKPVLVPKIVLHGITKSPICAGKSSKSAKRTLDQVEGGGAMSPARPKKFMKCASPLCQQKSKKTSTLRKRSRNTFLNRSTAASRARRTPGQASPSVGSRTRAAIFSATSFNVTLSKVQCTPSRHGNLSTEVQSFIKRNTPQKTLTYKEQQAAKEEQLKEKEARERGAKKRKEEEKKKEALERKKKTNEKLQRAAKLRMQREREENEKKAKMIEQWEKRVADADNVKNLRKKEEEAKGKILRKKQLEAAEAVRREEEERSKKIKEMELEKERRIQEQRLQKEQDAAAKRQAEQEKLQEKLKLEKLKEEREAEAAREREEEERMKKEAEERAKLRKAEEAARLRQQRHEKEELERKRKLQEEINRRNAEAAKLERERIEREKEAQRKQKEDTIRRQEEAIRRKEKEEARKMKLEEIKTAEEVKARKRNEEMAKTEELRKKREAIRKEAERRRLEEREAEKLRLQEEKLRKQAEENEKMRKIQEANERLKKLQEEQQKQKDLLKKMGQTSPCLNSTYNVSSYDMTPHVPKKFAPSTEDDYNINDISSGDSTDDDERPRKTVPKWAKAGLFKSALIKQYYTPIDINQVFDFSLSEPMDLVAVFKTYKPRYNKRTSSAVWNSPVKDIGHVSFSDYCRAQN